MASPCRHRRKRRLERCSKKWHLQDRRSNHQRWEAMNSSLQEWVPDRLALRHRRRLRNSNGPTTNTQRTSPRPRLRDRHPSDESVRRPWLGNRGRHDELTTSRSQCVRTGNQCFTAGLSLQAAGPVGSLRPWVGSADRPGDISPPVETCAQFDAFGGPLGVSDLRARVRVRLGIGPGR